MLNALFCKPTDGQKRLLVNHYQRFLNFFDIDGHFEGATFCDEQAPGAVSSTRGIHAKFKGNIH
jgi:hypothetical protein